jgi:hypothetical protein
VADPVWHEAGRLDQIYGQVRPASAPSLPKLLAQIDREFAGFAPVLKISVPSQSLLDRHSEAAAATA